ncbi:MAG: hypothetical protein KKF67_02145 [Nanoarchaeota archaeon]|nr:hypothetical protein [Nanoarchaeota archaeon]
MQGDKNTMEGKIQNARKRLYDLVGGEDNIWNTEINKENLARIGRVAGRTARNLAPVVKYPLMYGTSSGFVGGLAGGLIDGLSGYSGVSNLPYIPGELLGVCTGTGLGVILGVSAGLVIGIMESVDRFKTKEPSPCI